MLDSAMLSAMRDAIEQLLPDTCAILSVSRTADGQGGWSETWGTETASVTCRLDMVDVVDSLHEQVSAEGLRPYRYYMLSLPYDATVTTEHRIVHSGITYSVTSVNTSQSWQAVKRVSLGAL